MIKPPIMFNTIAEIKACLDTLDCAKNETDHQLLGKLIS